MSLFNNTASKTIFTKPNLKEETVHASSAYGFQIVCISAINMETVRNSGNKNNGYIILGLIKAYRRHGDKDPQVLHFRCEWLDAMYGLFGPNTEWIEIGLRN
jgi:hypothetical protein